MNRRTKDFWQLKLLILFIFIAVLIPSILNALGAGATGNLGDFETGETGIKLCAIINNGLEESLRFKVTNDQGFQADVLVPSNSCKDIETVAATYTIRQYTSQEYNITSVTGGTVSMDNTPFVATASGQYSIIYTNDFSQKPYLHNFGYTTSKTNASAVEVTFDANGGTGTMSAQSFGLNAQQELSANSFTRSGYVFDGWNTEADGTGENYSNQQQLTFATGGELTLYAQWKASRVATDIIAHQANAPTAYTIDFTRKAIVSDDIATANGNGVNKYTEKGQDVYYFRGQVDNNNVIWADKCWKIVRTTYTGGTKMIYNGVPSDVVVDGETVKQCLSAGADSQITVNVNGTDQNTFNFNNSSSSPADVGYMYGTRIARSTLRAGSTSFTFSNNVSRSGNTYTLDTSVDQSISGTWADERLNAAVRYHYFCTNGATSCDGTKIGYVLIFGVSQTIYYLNISGYDDIEAAKTAMFANTTDSSAKAMIETWFEQQNLDGHIADTRNYEDDLEDAIFCNDRTYYSGSLKGKDSDAASLGSFYGAYGRNVVKNASNNLDPSLDCTNQNDSFTKDDSTNGNAKLNHKIGLATADELTLAGNGWYGYDTTAYLYTGQFAWSASPNGFGYDDAFEFNWNSNLYYYYVNGARGLRPLVSLKSGTVFAEGGDGTATNPYIVE